MLLKNISLGLALFSLPSTNAGMFGQRDPAGVLKSDFQRRLGTKLLGKTYRTIDKQLDQDLDNFLEKLKYHGCQCSRFFNLYYDLDLERALIGGDHAVDELDAVCLDWYRARHCIESLPPAEVEHSSCSCTPNVDDVFLEINDQGECVTDGYGPCSTNTCEVDSAYSNSFVDVVMNYLGENSNNETDFSKFEPQIINEIGVCPKKFGDAEERVCTGTAPNFVSKRVSSVTHPRKRREVNEDCDPAVVELLGELGSCSVGYSAAADGQCVKNVCTCENGLAADQCDAAETHLCQYLYQQIIDYFNTFIGNDCDIVLDIKGPSSISMTGSCSGTQRMLEVGGTADKTYNSENYPVKSRSGSSYKLTFNESQMIDDVDLYWLNFQGKPVFYATNITTYSS